MYLTKPLHNKYLLCGLDNSTYKEYVFTYSAYKRGRVRGVYAFLSGTGLFAVARQVAQGMVIHCGKQRLATTVIGSATYVYATAILIIANSTRVIKSCKLIYTNVD